MVSRWTRFAGVFVCGLLGLFLGTSMYTFYYAQGASYFSNDPAACVNCHIMREPYDSWQKASHHAVAACNDCHLSHDNIVSKYWSKADNGFWHSYGFTFENFHEPIQIRKRNLEILENNCLRCHGELVQDITDQARAHPWQRGAGLSCVHCHSSVGHGPSK